MNYGDIRKMLEETLNEVSHEVNGNSIEDYMNRAFNHGARMMFLQAFEKVCEKELEEVTADV